MERLKAVYNCDFMFLIAVFTFQYGEIKSAHASRTHAPLAPDLHSSMERLKVPTREPAINVHLNLHSSMERLKDAFRPASRRPLPYLHSSMERLKVIGVKDVILRTEYLHSSMERLKARRPLPVCSRGPIYIPVWRD